MFPMHQLKSDDMDALKITVANSMILKKCTRLFAYCPLHALQWLRVALFRVHARLPYIAQVALQSSPTTKVGWLALKFPPFLMLYRDPKYQQKDTFTAFCFNPLLAMLEFLHTNLCFPTYQVFQWTDDLRSPMTYSFLPRDWRLQHWLGSSLWVGSLSKEWWYCNPDYKAYQWINPPPSYHISWRSKSMTGIIFESHGDCLIIWKAFMLTLYITIAVQ